MIAVKGLKLVVDCDDCDEELWDAQTEGLFTSREAATRAIHENGWEIDGDVHRCEACRITREEEE